MPETGDARTGIECPEHPDVEQRIALIRIGDERGRPPAGITVALQCDECGGGRTIATASVKDDGDGWWCFVIGGFTYVFRWIGKQPAHDPDADAGSDR